jgi:hypothetical protein
MRVVIAFEGKQTLKHQSLLPNALKWDEEPIPISVNADWSKPPVGMATDIQRDDEGVITAEVDESIVPEGYSATIYCDKLVGTREQKNGEDVYVVGSARIRALYFTTAVPWTLTGEMKET